MCTDDFSIKLDHSLFVEIDRWGNRFIHGDFWQLNNLDIMFDKSWLRFNRASNEYKEGARSFVETIEKEANYPEKLLCPCKFCRNLSHQKVNLLYEHLVINGIDPTYTVWFHHGEEAPRMLS
ncbi:hypothetical protein F8388_017112 [Cannabis sativa]|uniref:Transposase-associated domain-containing protein n=1 Tax=Cannabis sativa TaxID=3483 RepID=A0A7J6GD52_CANSA|nr:hypothetical protein F8388_017112 [Cannabis sativa]